jgi:hypothetical protein
MLRSTLTDQSRANIAAPRQVLNFQAGANCFGGKRYATLCKRLHQDVKAGTEMAECVVGDVDKQCAVARVVGCEVAKLAASRTRMA